MKLKKLGMLTPSSNTVLEPVTNAILSNVPGVSAHYARFRVTEVSLSSSAFNQFDIEHMMQAARMLADAKVDVIAYNGTSGGWVGFDNDRKLCEQITKETGIPATTSVLALNELFKIFKVNKYGIVSPCERVVVEKIIKNYSEIGLQCEAFQCSGISNNYECSNIDEETIKEMIRKVALPGIEVITAFGTNLWSAPLAEELEQELDITLLDTISAVVWKCLHIVGIPSQSVKGWGQLFNTEELDSIIKSNNSI